MFYYFNIKILHIYIDQCEAAGSNMVKLPTTVGMPIYITKGQGQVQKKAKFFTTEDLRRLQNEQSFSDNDMR